MPNSKKDQTLQDKDGKETDPTLDQNFKKDNEIHLEKVDDSTKSTPSGSGTNTSFISTMLLGLMVTDGSGRRT